MAEGTVFAPGLFAPDFWAAGMFDDAAPVIVPDVIGKTQAAAILDLQALGLTYTVQLVNGGVVLPGLVVSTSPAAGSEVVLGSAVTLSVARTNEVGTTRMFTRRPQQ